MDRYIKRVWGEVLKKSLLPAFIFIIVVSIYLLYRIKFFPYISPHLRGEIKKYITALFIVSISFTIQRIIGAVFGWYREVIASRTKTHLDEEFIPLLRRTSKVCVWIITLLLILPLFGINISALIAALGVSSLAIALAAQDTIANIIAGFMIMVDRPFRIGDRIRLPWGEAVTVLDIGIRRSRFLAEDDSIVIVPNLELSKSKIVNFTYGEERLKNNPKFVEESKD
jgi:small-conductance mechanosensitive channel